MLELGNQRLLGGKQQIVEAFYTWDGSQIIATCIYMPAVENQHDVSAHDHSIYLCLALAIS